MDEKRLTLYHQSMTDWAERQLEKENSENKASQWHEENTVRKARIKDQRGPALFGDLKVYLIRQVNKYNTGHKSAVLTCEADVAAHLESSGRDIRIRRKDGSRTPLTLLYSPVTHILQWECGAGKGHFLLHATDDGEAYFETPHHLNMGLEEIADDLLNKFMDSAI